MPLAGAQLHKKTHPKRGVKEETFSDKDLLQTISNSMVFISISLCSSFLLLLSSDKNSFYFLPENSKHLRITSVGEKNKTKRTQKAIKSRG